MTGVAIFVIGILILSVVLGIIYDYRAAKKRPKVTEEQRRQQREQLKTAFAKLCHAFSDSINRLPKEKQEELASELFARIKDVARYPVTNRVVASFPGCVVTYEPITPKGCDPDAVKKRFQEILEAYPNADLTKHELALGIKIVDVQRKGPQSGKPGVRVSFDE
jgi:hypothetical protein